MRPLSNGDRAPARFDANSADMLADHMPAAEFVQFLVTAAMVKSLGHLADGSGRAGRNATDARPAGKSPRRSRGFERRVRQDRDQTDAGAELRRDEEVVAADPAQAGQPGDGFMWDVGPLVLPIDDLGRRHGKGLEAEVLEEGRKQERAAVEEEIRLAVMMEVEGSRLVLDILENAVRQPFRQGQGPRKSDFERRPQQEFILDGRNIGHAEKGKSRLEAMLPNPHLKLIVHGNGPIVAARRRKCQRSRNESAERVPAG
jgi:hypothetical protein